MPSAGWPLASTSTARSWWTTAGECSGSSRARSRRRESMLLVADVGNTNTKIGVFDHARLLVSWSITSGRERTADEYGVFSEALLRARGIPASDIHGVAISNVVPPVQQTLEWMCEKYFGKAPFVVEPGVNTRMPLNVDAPREVGADRYVDAFAASVLYGPPVIVVNFGTATAFNCVNARGEFVGGAIAPGLGTAVDALVNRAARLHRVELVRPKEAIGRDTTTNIQSGAIYGFACLVDGVLGRLRAEVRGRARGVGTGGHRAAIAGTARPAESVDAHPS